MFKRIDGLRTLTLGEPGSELQKRLNQLVLDGIKTGTSSVDDGEYASEQESFETVGEKQWLVNESDEPIALIEFTAVDWIAFKDVSWPFVASEGEGFESIFHWQEVHRAFWSDYGIEVNDETPVICYSFRVIEVINQSVQDT